ncbi:MAG: hypothetical protein IMY71_13110 [Bacteroidetes bacterium]|nr:hypothetical protein [Bacteroidota bacterium]
MPEGYGVQAIEPFDKLRAGLTQDDGFWVHRFNFNIWYLTSGIYLLLLWK